MLSYRSTGIKLNYPNKILEALVTNIEGKEVWQYANGPNDRWAATGDAPRFYRWQITFSVSPQAHGSHLTRDDFIYNGLDVNVGDWIASADAGVSVKIISVIAKTTESVTCVVEDWLRYNTFKSPLGSGIFSTGPAVVFTLNENGIPMLDPFPSSASTAAYSALTSRYQYLNPQLNYVLEQPNHGFQIGEVIAATPSGFTVANATTAAKMIGVVTENGPGPNQFIILPNNRIIDFDPKIPGVRGDFIYIDANGYLSNVETISSVIVFLNIQEAIPTVITGTVSSPEVTSGVAIQVNKANVTFYSATGTVNASSIASQITANVSGVVASLVQSATTVSSNPVGTAYGEVGGAVPFSAAFDSGSGNTTVNFTTQGSLYAGYSTAQDMAIDINAANIANLSATANTTSVTLTEANGNSITITNVTPEGGGFYFVGASNISGLPAFTPASSAIKLQLTRADGGEILIYDGTGAFAESTGVVSGHTGQVPLALNIEQGIRTGGTTVVPNISARNSLSPLVGDQAHVINKGDGEWGLYLYDGSDWIQISNADSASTDAKTLIAEFVMPLTGNVTTEAMGNVSPGRKITSVSVDVNEVFIGASSTPTVTVGTLAIPELFMDANTSVLTESTVFITNPEYIHEATNTQDMVVYATINHYGASGGNVVVKLTYI